MLQNEEVQGSHNVWNKKIFVGVTYSNQSNHVLWPRVDFPNSFVLNLSEVMFGLHASLRRCGPWKLTWPEPSRPISFRALDYSNNKAFPKLDTCLLYSYQTHPHVTGFGYQDPSSVITLQRLWATLQKNDGVNLVKAGNVSSKRWPIFKT